MWEAFLLGITGLAVGGLILIGLLYMLVWAFFMVAGAFAGMACGLILAGMTNLLAPAISADETWLLLRYGADMGFLAGGLIGFAQALIICAKSANRAPRELKRRCLLVLIYSALASALTICAAFPEAVFSLISMVAIVLLAAGLANAIARGKTKNGKRRYEKAAPKVAGDGLTNAMSGARGLIKRSDWLAVAFATFSFLIMFNSPERPTLFEGETPVTISASARTQRPASTPPRATPAPASGSGSAMAAKAPTSIAPAEVYIVTTRNNAIARVRACPSTECALMGRAFPGDRIKAQWTERGEFINSSRRWIAFEHGSGIGYIHRSLLRLSD